MSPTDIDRTAPVIAQLGRIIAAPVDALWALHTDVARWPQWQRDVTSARLDGALTPGGSFTWTTDGLDEPVTSTIYALERGQSTLWGGPAAGITGVHRWTFTPVDAGTAVATEESWAGDPVTGDPGKARDMLERLLERWLDFLAIAATSGR